MLKIAGQKKRVRNLVEEATYLTKASTFLGLGCSGSPELRFIHRTVLIHGPSPTGTFAHLCLSVYFIMTLLSYHPLGPELHGTGAGFYAQYQA